MQSVSFSGVSQDRKYSVIMFRCYFQLNLPSHFQFIQAKCLVLHSIFCSRQLFSVFLTEQPFFSLKPQELPDMFDNVSHSFALF